MAGASLIQKEETMNLITRFELASLSDDQLRGLYRHVFNELAKSARGSHKRRNALASLENIQAELASRMPLP